MKKVLTLMVALLTAFNLFASDIIVTRDARRIEAKILEVSSAEVKYKEIGNLEGPTFVLTSAEINTIIYENGTVKIYEQPAQQPQAQQSANNYAAAQSTPVPNGLQIDKRDDYYYLGDKRMSEDQYLSFVRQNCPEAWDYYESGTSLWSAGWKCFGVGVGLTTVGAVLLGVGIAYGGWYYTSDEYYWGCIVPGAILTAVGGASLTASIPCLIVGGIRKNNSHEIYNEQCAARQQAKATPVTLGLTLGGNGVGVALNF